MASTSLHLLPVIIPKKLTAQAPPSTQLGPGSHGSSHHWVVLLQLWELLLALPQGGQKPPQLRKFKTSSH